MRSLRKHGLLGAASRVAAAVVLTSALVGCGPGLGARGVAGPGRGSSFAMEGNSGEVERGDTLFERVLAAEVAALESTAYAIRPEEHEAMLATVGRIVDEVRPVIGSRHHGRKASERDLALRVLSAIDQRLHAADFRICVTTELMVESLRPEPRRSDCAYPRRNAEPGGTFHHIDCDTGSLIYLEVAEQLGLPLSFVEIPRHNYLHWRLSDGAVLNWDVNEGESLSDEDYFEKYYGGNGSGLDRREIELLNELRGYGRGLTEDEIEGYFLEVLAGSAERFGYGSVVLPLLMRGVAFAPQRARALSLNDVAWALATDPSRSDGDPESGRLALRYAQRAVELEPRENYIDTLACAYAMMGQFQEAIAVEQRGFRSPERIAGFERGETCRAMLSRDSAP